MSKRCRRCGVEKPADEFYADSRRADGLRGRCKACEEGERRLSSGLQDALASHLPLDALGDSKSISISVSEYVKGGWGRAALLVVREHARREEEVSWRWWEYKGKSYGEHRPWVLTLMATVDGIRIEYSAGSYTHPDAVVLSRNLQAASKGHVEDYADLTTELAAEYAA